MHADTLSSLADNKLFAIIGLVALCAAFVLIVIRVITMDRKEIESMSSLPLENSARTSNGDTTHE